MDVGSVEVEATNPEQNLGDWTWVNHIDWNQPMGDVDYAAKGGGKGFNPGAGKGFMNPGAGKGQPWQQEKGGKGGGKSSNPMMQMAMAMMAKAMGKAKANPNPGALQEGRVGRKVINLDASIVEAKITLPDAARSQSKRREPAIAVALQATWRSTAGRRCQEE